MSSILHRRTSGPRRGSLLIAVLVCLGVATTIVLGIVKISLQQRRQLRAELQMEQTRWLLDAGVRHALAKIQDDRNFEGQEITLSGGLPKYPQALVEINVVNDQSTDQIKLKVTASLTNRDQPPVTMKRSHEIVVPLQSVNASDKGK